MPIGTARFVIMAALGSTALAGGAVAQTPAHAVAETMNSDEIVVTAQRRAENLQDVPIAVTALRGEALLRQNVTTPEQLVRIDPSVRYRQSTGPSSSGFLIRGIGTASFSTGVEQSIATVVDGVVLADPSTVGTLVDVDRVEILRGPQGMLFGKNASAGLVSITTNRPKLDETTLGGRAEVGTNGHLLGQAVANLPVTPDLAVRVVGFIRERDGVVVNVNPAFPRKVDGSKIYGGVFKALWQASDKLSLFLSADISRSDEFCCSQVWRKVTPGYAPAVTLPKFGIVAGPDNREVAISAPSYGHSTRGGASLEANYELGDHTITSLTAWRKSDREGFFDGDNTPVNYVDHNGGSGKIEQFSQELRLTSPKGKLFDYVAGLFYYRTNITGIIDQSGALRWIVPASNGQEIPVVPGTPPGTVFDAFLDNNVISKSTAAFAQGNLHATDKLTFIVGGRVTYDDLELNYSRGNLAGTRPFPGAVSLSVQQSTTNTNFSWRLGAQYEPADDLMAYATVSRGYKGPGFSGLTVTSVTQDQRVKPEIPTNYEIGIRSSLFDRKLQLNATLFLTDVKDFQAQVADLSSPNFANRVTNAGSLRSKGIEFNVVARPAEGLTLTGGGVFLDAKYKDFAGVQCYFGQPKVAQGGPCVAPPSAPNSLDGVFNAAGQRLAGAPRFSYAIGAAYEHDLGKDYTGMVQLNWNGQSDVNYVANGDPGTIQKAFGLLNANVGVGPASGRWRVGVFAINLLDKRWAATINPSPTTALNPGGYLHYFSPDSVRTVGVTLDFKI